MPVSHPDFAAIQRRLKRLDLYDPAIDDDWGDGISSGINAVLTLVEKAKGLDPIAAPAAAPAGKVGAKFAYLTQEPLPPLMVRIGLETLGLMETPGTEDNPVIIGWADEVARLCPSPYNNWSADWYNDDSVPWCGLWTAVVCARASQCRPDRFPPNKYLAALSWANWGVSIPKADAMIGDVGVLVRKGGGHVGIIVGFSTGGKSFFLLGGNQGDRVSIAEFPMERLYAARRPPYTNQPPGVRKVFIDSTGTFSTRES